LLARAGEKKLEGKQLEYIMQVDTFKYLLALCIMFFGFTRGVNLRLMNAARGQYPHLFYDWLTALELTRIAFCNAKWIGVLNVFIIYQTFDGAIWIDTRTVYIERATQIF
jgi:hypothetical protein